MVTLTAQRVKGVSLRNSVIYMKVQETVDELLDTEVI